MAKLISKTYGDALFELAVESETLDTLWNEVEAVLDILQANQEYIKLLIHPKLPVEEKIKMIEDVFKGQVSEDLVGFLVTVVDKGRFAEIEDTLKYFIHRVMEYKRIGVACITSASALTDEEKKAIEEKLLQTTSYVEFRMEYAVDSSLIGGMVIRIGDRVVDSSIKQKLTNMAKELSKIQLAN